MKKLYTYFSAFVVAIAAMVALTSCEETSIDNDLDVDVTPTPVLTSVTANTSLTSQTATSIDVVFANLVELSYSYYVSGDQSNAVAESVEVAESDTSYTISLTDLLAESEYTIEVTGTNVDGEQTAAVSATFTTLDADKPAITKAEVVEDSVTVDSASIEVATEYADALYYTIAEGDATASEPIEVALTEGVAVVELSELASSTVYNLVFFAQSEDGLYTSAEVTVSFTTLTPAPAENNYYSVSNFVVTPTSVTFDLVINDSCEGVILYADNASWFNTSYVNDQITYSYATIVTESGTTSLFSYDVTPNTQYKYILVPVQNIEEVATEWGGTATSCEMIGELDDYEVGEVTTGSFDTEFVINNATSNTVEITSTNCDITQIMVDISRNGDETIKAAYCGAVKTSELAGMSAIEWAVANSWFDYSYSNYFVTEYYTSETVTAYLSNLSDDTEYTIFTVPVTTTGAFGTVTTCVASTKSYDFTVNEDLKPSVSITPGLTSADITITFGDCAKVYYDAYSADLETATTNIYQNVVYGSSYYTNDGSGSVTLTISWLSSSTEYKFYCMGMDADGVYGAVCEFTYTTTGLSWDSNCTATVTQVSGSVDEYGFADVVFDIDLSDDAVKATIAPVDEAYIVYNIPTNWGKYILENTYSNTYITEDGQVKVTLYGNYYKLVVVPEDATGAYGTPIVTDIDWDALTPYSAE